MEYKLITYKNELDILMKDYFFEISDVRNKLQEALHYFSKKEGFGSGGKVILFVNDLDESDEAFFELQNNKVLFSVDQATSSANEDSEAYLSFQEFYEYLKDQVEKVSTDKPEEKEELERLLLQVKQGLSIE
ncbi:MULTISPECIES: ribonuclease toxin immunity protein CdiI [unclassified Bacillus (in: firmicutes)]|uniref:ribonuclease toxin immunity protein CdiI n=1 Tax=unclassified Bacillus (in: firmicutes) TaxID=185979 RepID=UPI0008EBF056|nr:MULTISPECIES: ribonuclease toxin immunity protein CdiI [unclassified Bacillus (in: firmicutes)]SFK03879.1 hypothetical protein SAMN04488574_1465 [Bacillus sp. 71mf]SFT20279.1 hypothetical protein SAMN04488145_12021 [Bacillus sp. 103mf]